MSDLQTPNQVTPAADQLCDCFSKIGSLVKQIGSSEELVSQIVEECRKLLRCKSASLALYKPHQNDLHFSATTTGADDAIRKYRIPIGMGIVGMVAKTRQPIVFNDEDEDRRWLHQMDTQTGFVTRNLAAVPIVCGEDLLGVLEALNRGADDPFTDTDVKLMRIFADQIAILLSTQAILREKQESQRLAAFAVAMADIGHTAKNLVMRLDAPRVMIDRAIERRDWKLLDEAWPILGRAAKGMSSMIMQMLQYTKEREPAMDLNDMKIKFKFAFTLIELLIVVVIIAILAAVAVPHFLEAQVRAKVARVKADLRTLATGLEAYAADANHYPPNDGFYNVEPIELTTPVTYLTTSLLIDPFSEKEYDLIYGDLARYYTYAKVVDYQEAIRDTIAGRNPPVEAVDSAGFNPGAMQKYGKWRLASNGPDREYTIDSMQFSDPVKGSDVAYDPTNGTVSDGNILRTQRETNALMAK